MAWSWPFSKPQPPAQPAHVVRVIRAGYDAAQTTDDNARHWAWADGLSARQANAPDVRQRLRERARYEVANNCYARGMANTLADLAIGRGPQLQILRDRRDPQLRADAELVERFFGDWAEEVGLWSKLWTCRVARAVDGEGCGLLRTDYRLGHPVKLQVQILETDHFHSPIEAAYDLAAVDGLELDELGQVVSYWVSRVHPSEASGDLDVVSVPADQAFMWFRPERPGQLRGVPEITPALPLFALLRRFTLATLHSAESAASFSGLLSTDGPAVEGPTPWERIEYERGALLTLPNGAKLEQLKSENPATTFDMFRSAILAEIGRAMGLPRGLALLDSSQYNYSSGRLDRQGTDQFLAVDRDHCAQAVLGKIWRAWLAEARLLGDYLPASFAGRGRIKVRWLWPGLGHVDRAKEAAGAELDLRLHTTTLADECARDGRDWEEVLEQRAEELARMRALGLSTDDQAELRTANQGDPTDEENELSPASR